MSEVTLHKLPEVVFDGKDTYYLVRQEMDAGDGKKWVALYAREVFTPDLAFVLGQTETPVMHRILL